MSMSSEPPIDFACKECGNPAVTLPRHLCPGALVRCGRCGGVFETWATFKERAGRVLLMEATVRGVERERLSADPLTI